MTSFEEAAKSVTQEDYVTHFMETAGSDWEPYRRTLYASQLDAFTYGKTISYPCDAHAYKLKSGRIWGYESGWLNRPRVTQAMRDPDSEDLAYAFSTEEGGEWQPFPDTLFASNMDTWKISSQYDYVAYRFKSGRIWDSKVGWRLGSTAKAPIVPAPNIFAQASDIIYGDREKTYGHPAKNLQNIVDQWTLYFKQKYGLHCKLSPEDVCWMMADLKKARQMNEDKHDNLLDAIGYIGLIDRIRETYQP